MCPFIGFTLLFLLFLLGFLASLIVCPALFESGDSFVLLGLHLGFPLITPLSFQRVTFDAILLFALFSCFFVLETPNFSLRLILLFSKQAFLQFFFPSFVKLALFLGAQLFNLELALAVALLAGNFFGSKTFRVGLFFFQTPRFKLGPTSLLGLLFPLAVGLTNGLVLLTNLGLLLFVFEALGFTVFGKLFLSARFLLQCLLSLLGVF
mmetsp:Transcript_22174/g.52211  ORF Transcript_22174/g.52211 Transcript_22174/m.52211 type:complete len:208 (-) Transcript_22174:144-767(-)